MTKIDALIAPRALTARELAEVLVPHLTVYAVAHRAFIHGRTLQDDTPLESAVVHVSESVLAHIAAEGLDSVNRWLADMDGDGQPRFYRKASLKEAVDTLCHGAATMAIRTDEASFPTLLDLLADRDRGTIESLIAIAGE